MSVSELAKKLSRVTPLGVASISISASCGRIGLNKSSFVLNSFNTKGLVPPINVVTDPTYPS